MRKHTKKRKRHNYYYKKQCLQSTNVINHNLKKQPTKERKYYKKSENRNSSIDVQKLKCQFKKNAASSKIIDSTESQHHSSQIHPASQHTTLFYDINRKKEHKR